MGLCPIKSRLTLVLGVLRRLRSEPQLWCSGKL